MCGFYGCELGLADDSTSEEEVGLKRELRNGDLKPFVWYRISACV